MQPCIELLLVDRDPLLRDGLKRMLPGANVKLPYAFNEPV